QPANSSPRWSSGRAGRAERTNRVLQSACSHESAKKAEVEGAWFLDTEAGQGGITQYGKALGMTAKEKNETRSGAEWGLQNRCSTTELTRQGVGTIEPFQSRTEQAHCYRFATIYFLGRLCKARCRASSTRAAASSCMPGRTWLYRSKVMPTLLCPSRSLATLGCTPLDRRWVAWAWRRSATRAWFQSHRIVPHKPLPFLRPWLVLKLNGRLSWRVLFESGRAAR